MAKAEERRTMHESTEAKLEWLEQLRKDIPPPKRPSKAGYRRRR